MANSAHVVELTLPPLGSMQCFTPTTESPSIAATSTARAPPKSSASPAIEAVKPAAGAVAVEYRAGPVDMPGGGRKTGAWGAGGAIVCANGDGAGAIGGGASGAGRAAGGAANADICGCAGADTGGRGDDATMSACGGACTRVGDSSISASPGWPIESSIFVSPTTIVSPDWSFALLTFWPLTNVPLVEPKSMMLTSPGPLTSMIACMRDTVSSSSFRWAEGTLPSLMTDRLSFSSRTNWSPLKMRKVRGTFAPAMVISPVGAVTDGRRE